MQVICQIATLQKQLNELKSEGKNIGFVPTMGALHQGHISLVERSCNETDITVVSIFVNPTQFNEKKDLENYPRTLEADLEKLKTTNCKFVFAPTAEEIYPVPDNRNFDFGQIANVMEGAFRPGHFNGVAIVVSKLFDIVKPNKAYFGEKDYQQLLIIKELVKQQNYDITIVPCSIFREADGLAMSSRNTLLSTEQRKNASFISQVLFQAKNIKNELSINELKKWVISQIDSNAYLQTEYFEIANSSTLKTSISWNELGNKMGFIVVKVGAVRLIDNILFD